MTSLVLLFSKKLRKVTHNANRTRKRYLDGHERIMFQTMCNPFVANFPAQDLMFSPKTAIHTIVLSTQRAFIDK